MVDGALSRWSGEFDMTQIERFMKDPLCIMSPEPQELVDAINGIQLVEDDNTSMLGVIRDFGSVGFTRNGRFITSERHIITTIFILSRLWMLPPLPAPYQRSNTKEIISKLLGRPSKSIINWFHSHASLTPRGLLHPPMLKDVNDELLKKIIKYLKSLIDNYVDELVDTGVIENNIPTLDGRGRGGGGTGGRGRGGGGTGGRGTGGGGTGGRGRGGGGSNERSDFDSSEDSDNGSDDEGGMGGQAASGQGREGDESDGEGGMGPNQFIEHQQTPERRSVRRRTDLV